MNTKRELNCTSALPLFDDHLSGKLGDETSALVREHLGSCESCKRQILEKMADGIFEAQMAIRRGHNNQGASVVKLNQTPGEEIRLSPQGIIPEYAEPLAIAAASPERPLEETGETDSVRGMKTFPYKRVKLKLQSDLENKKRTRITLEVRAEFKSFLEGRCIGIETKDGHLLLEGELRKGTITQIVNFDLNTLEGWPVVKF